MSRVCLALASFFSLALLARAGDFNGDGIADLVISAPGVAVNDVGGAIYAVAGSATGLALGTPWIVTAAQLGLPATPGNPFAASFGDALALGDFNGDGCDDVAIGAPDASKDGVLSVGIVIVVPGSASGLVPASAVTWSQDTPGVKEKIDVTTTPTGVEVSEMFGQSLAAGDFDGDGFKDLAIGSSEFVGSTEYAGGVNVLYGSSTGLTAEHDQMWTQNTSGVKGTAEFDDNFSSALAAGDLNGDGTDDLVVAVDSERFGTKPLGVVQVLYGGPHGLTSSGDDLLKAPNKKTDHLVGANFGSELTLGDFDGDGTLDLTLGAPFEESADANVNLHGSVWRYSGGPQGLDAKHPLRITQEDLGIPISDDGDFGGALAAGDFDGDGKSDLAIGFHRALIGVHDEAGGVWVITGTNVKQFWSQDASGILGVGANFEFFGEKIATADLNGDGKADLIVAALNDKNDTAAQGVVHCLFGTALGGVTSSGNQIFGIDTLAPLPPGPQTGATFGAAIAK